MKNDYEKTVIVQNRSWLWFGLTAAILTYLFYGTGIHGDDYDFLYIAKNWTLGDLLKIYKTSPTYFFVLPSMYFNFAQIYFFDHHEVWYDIAKTIISLFAVYAAWLFSSQYIEKQRAFLFSIVFVLYPLHDACNYWLVGSYFLMTGAWIMLAHVYINRERNFIGIPLGFIGAFWSYASPALFGGLSLTFLAAKEYKKFLLFIIPESIYIVYYLTITKLSGTSEFRTKDVSNISNVVKQLILQVGTFLDSAIGPSFWLKIYYSILSLSWWSFVVSILIGLFFLKLLSKSKPSFNKPLFIAFAGVGLCGFLIFAISGMYPQIAFNLGNRVTYYGSLLLALFLVSIPWKKPAALMVFFTLSMSIAGLSEHWKDWNQKQHGIIEAIRANGELDAIRSNDILFVSGNQYSHLGPISHIEFFSESYAVRDIISFAQGKTNDYRISSLNHNYRWENGMVKDIKYGNTFQVGNEISIYDSTNNKLLKIPSAELNIYIANLPPENRHWIQLVRQGWLKDAIIYLMPRLAYVFHN
ncbi:MAG: hypothetical protein WC091_07555 [Sulfuricellaceae bacterium]